MEDVPGPGGHREEGVIAADPGIPVVDGTLLRQTVRLADRRVEVDREGVGPGSRSCCPGPGEEMAADGVELADVTPAEAAQEGAQGGGGLHAEAKDPLGATGSQRVRIVDAVTTRERGHDERQELVAGVRPAGPVTEFQMLVEEVLETEVRGQGGRHGHDHGGAT